MDKKVRFLLSVVASAIIPISSYANIDNVKHANLPNLPKKNLSVTQFNNWKSVPAIQDKLKAENQREVNLLIDLKSKMNKLDLSNKDDALNKLTSLIEKRQKFDTNTNDNRINFLQVQLQDAYAMLNAVNLAAQNTHNILMEMEKLANQAANGTNSASQLADLDMEFQMYKSALHFAQTIDLYNGEKVLSGGDIMIQFGDNAGVNSRLVIEVPQFDLEGLLIGDTSISSLENAQIASYKVYDAMNIVSHVIAKTGLNINDALMMILIEPSMLNQQLDLLDQARSLAMASANGTVNDSQRVNLDAGFTYVKAAMMQSQTYVSLDGPKKLGYGNLHIQIGKNATPETVLNIQIPVADVEQLGLNKLDVTSQESAFAALSAIVVDTQKFIYG